MKYKGDSNLKFNSDNFHSFQFFKYHSFSGYTPANYPIIFYGEERVKMKVRFTKYLKENGYMTGYSNDLCYREPAQTGHKMNQSEICDHEFIICDPNIEGQISFTKRCLYNKLAIEQQLEYANQFWRKYKNNRKFFSLISNDGHEGTLEMLKYDDEVIYNFINNLFNDNLLKNSAVLLISDHGNGVPSLYYFNEFFNIEKHLPMFFLFINDRKNISYNKQYKNLYNNQQTFITAYDIFNTIGNIIYGDEYNLIKNKTKVFDTLKSPLGISLFKEIDQKTRSPKNYKNMVKYVCQ